jgi:hypothetical protein
LESGKAVLAMVPGEENVPALVALHRNDPLTVFGKLKKAEPAFVQLEDCELVDNDE